MSDRLLSQTHWVNSDCKNPLQWQWAKWMLVTARVKTGDYEGPVSVLKGALTTVRPLRSTHWQITHEAFLWWNETGPRSTNPSNCSLTCRICQLFSDHQQKLENTADNTEQRPTVPSLISLAQMLTQDKAEINNQSPDLCHLLNKLENCWMNIIRTIISHKSQPNFFKKGQSTPISAKYFSSGL